MGSPSIRLTFVSVCSVVDIGAELEAVAIVVVAVVRIAEYSFGSRRLNISRETNMHDRLATTSVDLAILLMSMKYLHVRHRGCNSTRYFLDDNVKIRRYSLGWRLTDPRFITRISRILRQTGNEARTKNVIMFDNAARPIILPTGH